MKGPGTIERGTWAGKLGFILAAAGSAVGLGNLWKFPWLAYKNGGLSSGEPGGAGAFVFVYLLAIALVGLPVMVGEIVVGRRAGRNPVGAFSVLRPGTPWKAVGALGVATGFVLLSYYAVVAGWTARYFLGAVTFQLSLSETGAGELFEAFIASPGQQVGWLAVFMGATIAVVASGVSHGIERVAKVLMPALFAMLLFLLWKVMSLDGADEAWRYLFTPDFSRLRPSTVLDAMGQAFFSLSLGMGAMITYGSYLSKKDPIGVSAVAITVLDTFVALVAALIIFGIIFSLDVTMPGGGIGNLFTALPAIFGQLPGGEVLLMVFYLLVVVAALTSTISLLEVVAAYFIDERGWGRKKAVGLMGLLIFCLGIPSALSFNLLSGVKLAGKTFFDVLDYLCANWSLPLGGFLLTIFVGWTLTVRETEEELDVHPAVYRAWLFCVRFVAPVGILAVLIGIVAGMGGEG